MTYEEILKKNVDAFVEHLLSEYGVDSMSEDKKNLMMKNLMSTTVEAYKKGFENGYDNGYIQGMKNDDN